MATSGDRFSLQALRPSFNVLGIDLGTINTVVALWMAGKPNPEVLTVENNERVIPSYVWCREDGTFDVGKNAVRNLKQYPQDVCYDAKRMIGLNYTTTTTLQSDYWSFKIVNNEGRPAYELSNGKKIEPEEISVQVLKKAKSIADAYAGANIEYAVITVPACFNQNQKQATLKAAEKAGLSVLQLETDSVASAYAFNYDHKRYEDYNQFIFDLGGGTFNITIISVKDGRFIVAGSRGNNYPGGRDFDNLLMKELQNRLKKLGAQNLDDVEKKIRLRAIAETTKVALTTCDKEIVNCYDFVANIEGYEMVEITRDKFEKLSSHLKDILKDSCLQCMNDAKFEVSDFHNVLPVGGSSRMPMVTQLLNEVFPQSLESLFFQSRGLNRDEVVAYGAAIRAAQLSVLNHRDYITIANVLPIGIGIGKTKDQYSLILPRGTKYPSKMEKRFFTTENDQTSANIVVYEGERVQASQNREILSFVVPNLPPGLAGDVYVDVTFELDNNGLLKAVGKSPTSVGEGTVDYRQVRQAGKPIEQLFRELTLNAENDQQKKILIEARVELRSNVENIKNRYQNEKNVPHHKKKGLLENCDGVLEWLDDHPDVPLDEDTIDLAKQIEKDVKELINLIIQLSEIHSDFIDVTLTRSHFEKLSEKLLSKVKKSIGSALKCKSVSSREINHVLFVGGASKMPMIATILKQFFNEAKFSKTVNAEEIVALGATRMAAKLGKQLRTSDDDIVIRDIVSLMVGIKIVENGKTRFKKVFDNNAPYGEEKTLTTVIPENNREKHKIELYEGLSNDIEENKHIGSIIINELPMNEYGENKVDLKLTIDKNGIIRVVAENNCTVEYKTQLYYFQKTPNVDQESNAAGIDFGNTTCFVAITRNNGIEAITFGNTDEKELSSYVAYDEKHVKCGKAVIERMLWHSKSTVYDIKKIIGKTVETIEIVDKWPFKIINTETNILIQIESLNGQTLMKHPNEVLADMLNHIKEKIHYHEKKFKKLVFSIPLSFNNRQKEAIRDAASLAGFSNVKLLPDPISAFYAYYSNQQNLNKNTILVFDLGGSSLELCILRVDGNEIDIIGKDSDLNIGGKCFDNVLKEYIEDRLNTELQISDLNTEKKQQKLTMDSIKIKESLMYLDIFEYFYEDVQKDCETTIVIPREKFEDLSKPLLSTIQKALEKIKHPWKIDTILQIGGGCRMPMIKKLLNEMFPGVQNCCHKFPEEVVAIGAAFYAKSLIPTSKDVVSIPELI